MPLPAKAPKLLAPAPTPSVTVPAVTETRLPDEGPGQDAVRKTVGADWFPVGNAAAGVMLSGSPPGMPVSLAQMLVAGQPLVGNAMVARRAASTPPGATAPSPKPSATARPGAVRTKSSPAAGAPDLGRANTVERADSSRGRTGAGGRRSPGADPKFRALTKDVAAKKRRVGASHPPAKVEAGSAQAASVPPKDDQEARGKAAHAEDMNAAQPKEFNKEAFIKAVKEAIAARAPKNLDQADKFGDSGKAEEVKTEVQGQVGAGKDASAKDIADTTAQTPQPAPDAKTVVPMVPDQPPGRPAGPNPTQAAPDRLPATATDMSAGPDQVDQQMADAQVTEPQLARSNEPAFTEALADKKALDAHADTAPKQLRGDEATELTQVKQSAATQGSQAMAGMLGARVATGQQVDGGKTRTKGSDEDKRTQVTALLQVVFDATKCDVEKILSDLDKKVDEQFTKGEKAARDRFTREHKLGMAEYKKKRYAPPEGWGRWIKDRFRPLPKAADRIYEQARDNYLTAMDLVITGIAGIVETELRRAKDRIAKGRKQLRDAVHKLPEALRAIGREAAEDFAGKFDDLTDTVDNKGTELVDTLATRYTDAVKQIDDQIAKEKEKNKNLFDKAADKVGDVVKTITDLKNMLMGVLRKAVAAIKAIIADPIKFLKNLVDAVGGGLKLFMKNIGKHMQQGVLAWLMGTGVSAGLHIPTKFDVLGIVLMIASLVGLTWENIRARIVRKAPEQAVAAAESSVFLVIELKQRGVAGAWGEMKDQVGDPKKDLISKLIAYLTPTIVIAGIVWILSLLNPASAFVRACKMIIDIIRFIITQGAQIIEFVNSVLDAVLAIARGGGAGVPAMVENALARSIPVLIGALAAILGIGGIANKVRQVIHVLSRPVNKALDRVIDKIVALVKKLWNKIKSKFEKDKDKKPDKPDKPEEEQALKETEEFDEPRKPRSPQQSDRPKDRQPADRPRPDRRPKPADRDRKPADKDRKEPDDKVFEWWRLKRPFRLRSGEAHTVAFSGDKRSATLVIKSVEHDYRSYIQAAIPDPDPRQKVLIERALRTAGQIQALMPVLRLPRPGPKALRKLRRLMSKLAEQTIELVDASRVIPKSTPPIYGPLSAGGGFGTIATVAMLTSKGQDKGSKAVSDLPGTAEWHAIEPRKPQSTGRRLYRLGHLLNKHLGGPGDQWKNLTPITSKANKAHLDAVEARVKQLVNVDHKGVYYSVQAVYRRKSVSPAQISAFQAEWAKNHNNAALILRKTDALKAEQYVATALGWEYQILWPKNERSTKVSNVVVNDIQQDPKKYHMKP